MLSSAVASLQQHVLHIFRTAMPCKWHCTSYEVTLPVHSDSRHSPPETHNTYPATINTAHQHGTSMQVIATSAIMSDKVQSLRSQSAWVSTGSLL
jgi:hypothetical protein